VLDNWAWQYRPQEGDTIIDVGAGVGEEAVVFSKIVGPRGRILAIEAHPATFACLEATVQHSNLTNVIPIWCAVTDWDGTVTINDGDNHLASSVLMGGRGQSVPSRSLDSLATELELGPVALLKMNIEGAERAGGPGHDGLVEAYSLCCHLLP
jgi:FkbM family methyltransferase